jgi:phosphate butyryltransferase
LASKEHGSILMGGQDQSHLLLKYIRNEEFDLVDNLFLSHIKVIDILAYHKFLLVNDCDIKDLSVNYNILNGLKHMTQFARSLGVLNPKVSLIGSSKNDQGDILTNQKEFHIDGPFSIELLLKEFFKENNNDSHIVVGDADILIFSSNELCQTLLANSSAAGILYGAKNPIILTSHSDSYQSILYSIALAVVSTDVI